MIQSLKYSNRSIEPKDFTPTYLLRLLAMVDLSVLNYNNLHGLSWVIHLALELGYWLNVRRFKILM